MLSELQIVGAIDLAHASAAEQPDDAIALGEDGAGGPWRVSANRKWHVASRRARERRRQRGHDRPSARGTEPGVIGDDVGAGGTQHLSGSAETLDADRAL